LAIACLIYAIREFSVPILESEVLEVADRPRMSVYGKSLKRAKFYLVEELGLRFKTLSPLAFLPRVLTALRSNERVLERFATCAVDPERVFAEIEVRAREVLSDLTFVDHEGKRPMHLAVSCCHVLSSRVAPHERLLTQALISEVCGISTSSIRGHQEFWRGR
jgi:transcription initiation factor TFIIIB Brf1 subunit/transcription initiation factor TFIIB